MAVNNNQPARPPGINVLVYLNNYPPHRHVGGELATSMLLEHLVTRGHNVTVYAERTSIEDYYRNGVLVRNAGFLYRRISRDFDVFITHPEIRTMAWPYIHEMPYIGIVHNTDSGNLRSVQRLSPDLTIANSEATASRMPGIGNLHVIHPPLRWRDKIAWTAGDHVTLVNLSIDKGVGMFSQLASHNPLLSFLGVKGGYRAQMDVLPPNVMVMGHTDDMRIVYDMTKVLVVPSIKEAYGMVVAEAMHYGIPVVASDLPGVREAGGDAVIYCPPEGFPQWNAEVNRLMSDQEHWNTRQQLAIARGEELRARTLLELDTWGELVENYPAWGRSRSYPRGAR